MESVSTLKCKLIFLIGIELDKTEALFLKNVPDVSPVVPSLMLLSLKAQLNLLLP